jgi:hypothetical protein
VPNFIHIKVLNRPLLIICFEAFPFTPLFFPPLPLEVENLRNSRFSKTPDPIMSDQQTGSRVFPIEPISSSQQVWANQMISPCEENKPIRMSWPQQGINSRKVGRGAGEDSQYGCSISIYFKNSGPACQSTHCHSASLQLNNVQNNTPLYMLGRLNADKLNTG